MHTELSTIVSAAQGRAWDDALVGLLAWFREEPHPRVAALVGEVSKLAEKGLPAITGKNLDARLAAAEALLAEGHPRDLPRVLRLFRELRLAQVSKLLAAVAKVPPDPRIHDAAVALLRDPPFSSSTSMPFWRAFLEVVDQQQDPRTRPALTALDFSWLPDWSAETFRTAIARLGVPKGKKRGTAKVAAPMPELGPDGAPPVTRSRRRSVERRAMAARCSPPSERAPTTTRRAPSTPTGSKSRATRAGS